MLAGKTNHLGSLKSCVRIMSGEVCGSPNRSYKGLRNWCTYGAIKPSRIARTTAWMRFLASSRFIAREACHSTVLSDRRSILAIADEDNPCATKFKISRSRAVRCGEDGGGGP